MYEFDHLSTKRISYKSNAWLLVQFKRYIQLIDMINSANNTKFMSDPFQNKSYYEIVTVTENLNMLREMKAYYYALKTR